MTHLFPLLVLLLELLLLVLDVVVGGAVALPGLDADDVAGDETAAVKRGNDTETVGTETPPSVSGVAQREDCDCEPPEPVGALLAADCPLPAP